MSRHARRRDPVAVAKAASSCARCQRAVGDRRLVHDAALEEARDDARAAPPAPSTSAADRPVPAGAERLRRGWRRSRCTSVLSPCTRPSSSQSVLTAASRRARSVVASAKRKAASLCGMVTLPPRKPFPCKAAQEIARNLRLRRRRARRAVEAVLAAASSRGSAASANARSDGRRRRPSECSWLHMTKRPRDRKAASSGSSGKAEDGGVVALDPLEQVDAEPSSW